MFKNFIYLTNFFFLESRPFVLSHNSSMKQKAIFYISFPFVYVKFIWLSRHEIY